MKKIFTAAAVALLIISCGNASKNETFAKADDNAIANAEVTSVDTSFAAPQEEEKQGQDKKKQEHQKPASGNPDWDKKIIKTASLNLEIKDYNNYNSSLRDKVKQAGGYIAQEEQTQSDYKIENTLVIKVPVDQFDNAVNLFTSNAENIDEKKITSQDVTTEVVDTKARLEAKKQVRQRYVDLLKQAKNMEEILSIQSEINDIQEEIESATGRMDYLSHAAAFSTINLTFYQVVNATAKDPGKPAFGTKLNNAFRIGWDWVGELFIGIVSIWPLLLMIFAAFIIYKKSKVSKPKQA